MKPIAIPRPWRQETHYPFDIAGPDGLDVLVCLLPADPDTPDDGRKFYFKEPLWPEEEARANAAFIQVHSGKVRDV